MTNLDRILKSRDITLPRKVHLVKAMVFLVVMYGRNWQSNRDAALGELTDDRKQRVRTREWNSECGRRQNLLDEQWRGEVSVQMNTEKWIYQRAKERARI